MPAANESGLLCQEALELPYDLLAYERWLNERNSSTGSPSSYLFLEPRVRFSPEADDRLSLVSGVSLRSEGNRAILHHTPTGTKAPIEGLEPSLVERIIEAIDGKRSVIATQLTAGATFSQMDVFLRGSFGRFTLCPETLGAFEARINACGLVRFPGSPYEIDRYYWSNMADVRDAWATTLPLSNQLSDFVRHLKHLHVLALIGSSGRSFYRPSSPIVHKAGARPGAFYTVPSRTLRDLDLTLFVDGPRVSAPFVGGKRYHELLAHSLSDPAALLQEREIIDADGTPWGKVTVGQAREDIAPAAWFIPPRPITIGHLEQLYRSHHDATLHESLSHEDWLARIAAFHYYFIRLHPFTCANQSLAMTLVNGLLGHGNLAPVPHLILDQLALRLSRDAYGRLFRRVVKAWSLSNLSPEERQRKHIEQRTHLDRFVSHIGQAESLELAEAAVQTEPLAARVALLSDD